MTSSHTTRATLIIGTTVFLITGSVNLQVPLYGLYAEQAGLSAGGLSLLLAGYVAGLFPMLLVAGGFTDRIGHRPVLRAAAICAFIATGLVWLGQNTMSLGVARWFQGFSVALSMGSSTAWLTDRTRNPVLAARVVGSTSTAGFGLGALVTQAFIWAAGSPTGGSFALWCVALAFAAIALSFLEDGPPPDPTSGWLRLPAFPVGSGLPGVAIATGWTVAGIVIAIFPPILRTLDADRASGFMLFGMLATGFALQGHVSKLAADAALKRGTLILTVGTLLLSVGAVAGSVASILIGACVAGAATHGFLFVGGLTKVGSLAGSRARNVSGYFLFAYIGFGLPNVALGWLSDQAGAMAAFATLTIGIAMAGSVIALAAHRDASPS